MLNTSAATYFFWLPYLICTSSLIRRLLIYLGLLAPLDLSYPRSMMEMTPTIKLLWNTPPEKKTDTPRIEDSDLSEVVLVGLVSSCLQYIVPL